MAATKYKQISVAEIKVNRERRQRRDLGDIGALADSIKRLGLINPITVTKDLTLVAGERRLTACKSLDEEYQISVRFLEELDQDTLAVIELEENIKREDLSWQDRSVAVHKIHQIYSAQNPEWSSLKTAERVGASRSYIDSNCAAADALLKGDTIIAKAETFKQALNMIERATSRAIDNELNLLLETEEEEPQSEVASLGASARPAPAKPDIICEDFTKWVISYSSRRFNLIHCDFPYGIDHGNSEQGGTASGRHTGYEDSESGYFNLCRTLAKNIDKLMTPSGHLMFWFSMKFYRQTIELFEKHSDLTLVMEQPLIWYKSDGKGIVSDVNRRPRNVYETALLFSRGDRKIITPIDNCYSCPTGKSAALHVSEKPEPVLRHFFRMFIDSYSEVLDPTCGGGSALRAADALGAKRILGLEINKDFAEQAQLELAQRRALNKAAITI